KSIAVGIAQDFRLLAIDDSDNRIGSAEIDADGNAALLCVRLRRFARFVDLQQHGQAVPCACSSAIRRVRVCSRYLRRYLSRVVSRLAAARSSLAKALERSERMAIASAPALACSLSTFAILVASIRASRASIASINNSGSRTVSSFDTDASMPLRLSR